MTTSGLFRLNGFALVLSAVVFAIAEVIAFSIFAAEGDYDFAEVAASGTFFLQSFLTLFAGTLLLGGLVGFYLRQSEAVGRLGLVGFLLAFFGTVFVVGDFYANTFVTPLVAQGAPEFLDDPLSGMMQVWLPFSFGFLAFSWLLLAVVTLRAGVYPRGASWFLLVGVVLALVPFPLANLPFYGALGLVGRYLMRVREDAPRRGRRRSKKPRR
ncbi:MAG TPA: hypothetical protein VGV91_00995 [Rubrobacter sp.]|nr:hypothetical protein [Rubrobacter sp.]